MIHLWAQTSSLKCPFKSCRSIGNNLAEYFRDFAKLHKISENSGKWGKYSVVFKWNGIHRIYGYLIVALFTDEAHDEQVLDS